MAAKTTLNAKNLEALGVQRLSELLIEISTGSAINKRKLRLELAGAQGSGDVAREVRKRLVSIQRARTSINWRKVKSVKLDLETQRTTIAKIIAADDPDEALDLIWQFLGLADSIFERSDDGNGTLIDSFHLACADAGRIAQSANVSELDLAQSIFGAVKNNDYGQFDPLIPEMASALGETGLGHLRTLLTNWLQEPEEKPDPANRQAAGWGLNGPIYLDEVYGRQRDRIARLALQEISDAQGDVDAYIAQQPDDTHGSPMVAADIATRLTAAGRAEESLAALDRVDPMKEAGAPFEWQQARIEALEALGRAGEAQTYRWTCFEQTLSDKHLRAYLKRLPDFDDIEAEEKAFAFVEAVPDIHRALAFFLRWPALREAAKLVVRRQTELDGDLYELLAAAADTLQEKHPLAATLVLRSMIDFSLDHSRASRYKHAARHMSELEILARQITDYGGTETHEMYLAGIQSIHAKKQNFWRFLLK